MAADERRDRERDLVLSPNESCFIQDATKGAINTYCGPFKTSLAGTDVPVIFNEETKKFERRTLEEAVKQFIIAPESWYVVLKNVEAVGNQHPQNGACSSTPPLNIGHKVNIPGPVSFALWPGQMAKVIKGHHLRSNQYLIVRVYDEVAARANLAKAVVKRQQDVVTGVESDDAVDLVKEDELVLGKLIVVKGTDVSFYIPPTGIEVVGERQDDHIKYVRDAVTLERLEYCLLLDQRGTKRYEQGPQVVFPLATESFVEKNVGSGDKKIMTRKFRSIELNEASGIYVKVIAPYEEGSKKYNVGDELFITGKDQMIYYPREEHAMIKYGSQEIYYGIAIPAGEARYVMDRVSGNINLQKGPCVFLPDPRKEVIVRRILDLKLCELMYPGNKEAIEVNAKLANVEVPPDGELDAYVDAEEAVGNMARQGFALSNSYQQKTINVRTAARGFGGDAFDRKNKHTKPRTLVLDTKYEGAVTMDVWNGYAVKLVKKTGESRVVVGPSTVLLDYDEQPQVISLSRGKPKVDSQVFKTAYLRVKANKVSDVIQVETKDLCRLNISLSYRISFEGDSKKWFDVDNYVKFLTDHLRSKLRNAVNKFGIEEFYGSSTDIIRDAVLGKQTEDAQRQGMFFEENNMRIYDVEVFNVVLEDASVEKMLVDSQRDVIGQTLVRQQQRRNLEHIREIENIKQQIIKLETATKDAVNEAQLSDAQRAALLELKKSRLQSDLAHEQLESNLKSQELSRLVMEQQLQRDRATKELSLEFQSRSQNLELEKLAAEATALVQKTGAITPDLIAALQAFGDKALLQEMSKSLAPLTILGGNSVVDVLKKALDGTKIADTLKQLSPVDKTPKK